MSDPQYALLQVSLEQTIDRRELEEASVVAPSVARADCARLQKELFGIVVDKLDRQEALDLQAALRQRSFPTELVEQARVPVLLKATHRQGLRLAEGGVVATDLYGRDKLLPRQAFVFAAAGLVDVLKNRRYRKMEWQSRHIPRGGTRQWVEMVTDTRPENAPEFWIEFFFTVKPRRVRWTATDERLFRFDSQPFTLRDRTRLLGVLQYLATSLPADRVNLGIGRAAVGEMIVYPSVRAFEEEIVWRFYQLTRSPPA